jgi:cytochrome c oxidase subunit 1
VRAGADIYFHDTYFVIAHFHYTFFPIAFMGTFWGWRTGSRRCSGMMNETLGKIHFWLTFISFHCIFIPLFVLGLAGQHRRIYDYTHFPDLGTPDLQAVRIFATVSLLVLLASQAIFLYNFFYSMFFGEDAPANPWDSCTLEWTVESPPPHGNFGTKFPEVYRGPYEYSDPDHDRDFWPQSEPS